MTRLNYCFSLLTVCLSYRRASRPRGSNPRPRIRRFPRGKRSSVPTATATSYRNWSRPAWGPYASGPATRSPRCDYPPTEKASYRSKKKGSPAFGRPPPARNDITSLYRRDGAAGSSLRITARSLPVGTGRSPGRNQYGGFPPLGLGNRPAATRHRSRPTGRE
jgi:hypothetical protein